MPPFGELRGSVHGSSMAESTHKIRNNRILIFDFQNRGASREYARRGPVSPALGQVSRFPACHAGIHRCIKYLFTYYFILLYFITFITFILFYFILFILLYLFIVHVADSGEQRI